MGILRKTKSVQLVLDIFQKSENAISVVNLVGSLSNQMNKTTVYRILDRLEQEGIVHSFIGNEGLKWFAKCAQCSSHTHSDDHPHFQCDDCGSIQCLEVDIKIPSIIDHKINTIDIMMTGKCKDCLS